MNCCDQTVKWVPPIPAIELLVTAHSRNRDIRLSAHAPLLQHHQKTMLQTENPYHTLPKGVKVKVLMATLVIYFTFFEQPKLPFMQMRCTSYE